MIRHAKRAVHRALNSMGYEISRPAFGLHGDAMAAQQHLLAGKGAVVLDVGANVGQTSLRYAAEMPAATIHAFEPFPGSYVQLQKAVAGTPRVVPHPFAVGDRRGMRELRVNVRGSTNSFFETSPEAGAYVDARLMKTEQRVGVEVVTLDDFCRDHDIERVSVLKMDIQGGELLALHGARSLLADSRVDLVYSEVLFAPLYEGQADFCAVHAEIIGHGYRLYGLYDTNYGANGLLAWADALWVSPGLANRSG